MKDYGNITAAELTSKDYDWFFQQALCKRDLPHSILSRLRMCYPDLVELEKSNFRDLNLKFAITLIEKLRHVIVHNAGWTKSKEDFIVAVAKQAGVYNNGNIAKENIEFVNDFFGIDEYENMIALLEVKSEQILPLESYVCRVGILIEILLGYGHFILQLIKSTDDSARA